MKKAYIQKTTVTDVDLELINKYTRREMKADEIYTFSVVLCDNDIDRDYERFTEAALNELAKLFVGKTGIFDHSMKGRDQIARIYHCETQKTGELLSDGSEYIRLTARAYLPRTSKTEDFILSLESGIIKEVSVGCAVKREICSICGKDLRQEFCEHKKGSLYSVNGEKRLCYTLLDMPYDAYEWSFVAVPAQRRAGVVKSFEGENKMNLNETLKSFGEHELTISVEEGKLIKSKIHALEKCRSEYLSELKKEAVKSLGVALPQLNGEILEDILSKLEPNELKELTKAGIEKSVAEVQLKKSEPSLNTDNYDSFIV